MNAYCASPRNCFAYNIEHKTRLNLQLRKKKSENRNSLFMVKTITYTFIKKKLRLFAEI